MPKRSRESQWQAEVNAYRSHVAGWADDDSRRLGPAPAKLWQREDDLGNFQKGRPKVQQEDQEASSAKYLLAAGVRANDSWLFWPLQQTALAML